ncbi:MAG: hypothetical protein ACE5JM_13270 [Armatimonadota bacterium]
MRCFLFVGMLSLMIGIVPPDTSSADETPPGNLISNPSFEERSGPRKDGEPWGYGLLDGLARSPFAHWGYSGFWEGGNYDIKLGKGHSGKLCARLVCRKRGRAGICTEQIRVPVGAKLRFRGFFRAKGAIGHCVVNFEGEPGEGWTEIALPKEADYDWTEVTGVVEVPPARKNQEEAPDGKVGIYVFVYTRAYGELWIDDVTLTPVTEESPAPGD